MKATRTVGLAVGVLCIVALGFGAATLAQTSQPGSVTVPRVISYSGTLVDANGRIHTQTVTLTFGIYADQSDSTPLWTEAHQVQPDMQGRYLVLLGSTTADGLPLEIFAGGAARWLGVRVNDATEEGSRAMLLSVPYALKAAEAEKLGGYTVDQFVLAPTGGGAGAAPEPIVSGQSIGISAISPAAVTNNFLQKGLNLGITDSTVYENAGNVGIGTVTPQAPLQIYGVDNTVNAFPELLISDNKASAIDVGGGFGLQGRYAAGTELATFGAMKGGKETGTLGNYTGYLAFFTQPGSLSERMRITSAGNVGIGWTAPQARLHVLASSGSTGFFEGPDNTGNAFPMVLLADSKPMAQNVGGGFGLQGRYIQNSSSLATFAAVKGGKEDATNTSYLGYLAFFTQGGSLTEKMRITASGNIGIGTTTPFVKLHVAGNTWVDGNLTAMGNVGIGTTNPLAKLHVVGNLRVDGSITSQFQDVAEYVGSDEPLEAGTIVVIEPEAKNRVRAAETAYDTGVLGAVSAQPGILLGEPGPDKILVAQSGRVRVKVDASYGALRAGDLLVSSPRKGYAMRSEPVNVGGITLHRPGTLIGKALEPLPDGSGEILVLLTLQ